MPVHTHLEKLEEGVRRLVVGDGVGLRLQQSQQLCVAAASKHNMPRHARWQRGSEKSDPGQTVEEEPTEKGLLRRARWLFTPSAGERIARTLNHSGLSC